MEPWQRARACGRFASAADRGSGDACQSLPAVLQARGFTCGYDDLLLVPHAEAARKGLLARAEEAAVAASARYVGVGLPPGFEEGHAEVLHVARGALPWKTVHA